MLNEKKEEIIELKENKVDEVLGENQNTETKLKSLKDFKAEYLDKLGDNGELDLNEIKKHNVDFSSLIKVGHRANEKKVDIFGLLEVEGFPIPSHVPCDIVAYIVEQKTFTLTSEQAKILFKAYYNEPGFPSIVKAVLLSENEKTVENFSKIISDESNVVDLKTMTFEKNKPGKEDLLSLFLNYAPARTFDCGLDIYKLLVDKNLDLLKAVEQFTSNQDSSFDKYPVVQQALKDFLAKNKKQVIYQFLLNILNHTYTKDVKNFEAIVKSFESSFSLKTFPDFRDRLVKKAKQSGLLDDLKKSGPIFQCLLKYKLLSELSLSDLFGAKGTTLYEVTLSNKGERLLPALVNNGHESDIEPIVKGHLLETLPVEVKKCNKAFLSKILQVTPRKMIRRLLKDDNVVKHINAYLDTIEHASLLPIKLIAALSEKDVKVKYSDHITGLCEAVKKDVTQTKHPKTRLALFSALLKYKLILSPIDLKSIDSPHYRDALLLAGNLENFTELYSVNSRDCEGNTVLHLYLKKFLNYQSLPKDTSKLINCVNYCFKKSK